MTKLIVVLRNFANASKKQLIKLLLIFIFNNLVTSQAHVQLAGTSLLSYSLQTTWSQLERKLVSASRTWSRFLFCLVYTNWI